MAAGFLLKWLLFGWGVLGALLTSNATTLKISLDFLVEQVYSKMCFISLCHRYTETAYRPTAAGY